MDLWAPGKILVTDDSHTMRQSITAVLKDQGHLVYEAQDGAKALWSVRTIPSIEMVLLDLEMPVLNGLGLLRILRDSDDTRQLPVIMISSVHDNDRVVECLYAGANDFVRKPIIEQELAVRVRNMLALNRTLRELTDIAKTDHLTGLANKRHLDKILLEEMERSRRSGSPMGVIFADLDHFKLVNDQYGHQVGDEILQGFAKRLQQITRPYDRLCRFGGEEFVVVSPGISGQGLRALAERIRQKVAEQAFATSEGGLKVTTSLGCTSFNANEDQELGDILARADGALYLAKESGRNRVIMAQ